MTSARGVDLLHLQEEVMGTIVTFDLYVPEDAPRDKIYAQLARAKAALHRADAVFSIWKPNSPMSQLRAGAATIDEVPHDIVDVLELCRTAKELTRGVFDPWALPGGIDPTGYVKGWAAQRALDLLADLPLVGAIVNAAGDIASFGGPNTREHFRVGITDPKAKHHLVAIARLKAAIATSGTSERGDHLYDPTAQTFRAAAASATVTGPDLGLADALATAIAVAGSDALEWLGQIPGYEGFVIANNGAPHSTPGFPFVDDETATTP